MFKYIDLTCVHSERAFVSKACRCFAVAALTCLALVTLTPFI